MSYASIAASAERAGRGPVLSALELDDHQNRGLVALGAGQVPALAVDLAGVLVAAERNFPRPHDDTLAVHRFDEPATRQRHDPLRLRVLMPCADPADR